MPSKSKKQADFMRAAAHNPKFARKAGIKPAVAKEFYQADKRTKKYQMGGLASANMRPAMPQGPNSRGGLPGTVPNGVLSTAQDHLQRSNNRLGQMRRGLRFRKGGRTASKRPSWDC